MLIKPHIFKAHFMLLRPYQWVKSGFVLAPLFFSFSFFDQAQVEMAILATLCFTFLASGCYVLNDINDAQEDRCHPLKRHRPVANGDVSIASASMLALLVFFIAGFLLLFLPLECTFIILGYLGLQVLYNCYLRLYPIIDVLVVASGFVMRLIMGGFAISVLVSPWIILTTYLLALFLGFGKRYNEMRLQGKNIKRASLHECNIKLIEKLITVSCGAALMSYALYTVEVSQKTGAIGLVYTVFFVIYGLFSYLRLIYVEQEGGEPEKALFKNKAFLMNGVCWILVTLWLLQPES